MRKVVLAAVLVFIAVLGALTVDNIIIDGIDTLTVLSVAILLFFGVAIVGALLTPSPPED